MTKAIIDKYKRAATLRVLSAKASVPQTRESFLKEAEEEEDRAAKLVASYRQDAKGVKTKLNNLKNILPNRLNNRSIIRSGNAQVVINAAERTNDDRSKFFKESFTKEKEGIKRNLFLS